MNYLQQHGKKLVHLGYTPLPLLSRSKGVFENDWPNIITTDEHIDKWLRDGCEGVAYKGIGIQSKYTPAVDLDIREKELCEIMIQKVHEICGNAPVRIGMPPKALLPFRTSEPFAGCKSPVFTSPDGEKHQIEILAGGQQFVAYNIHQDTGNPYEWSKDLMDIPWSELPELDTEKAVQIIKFFEKECNARSWTSNKKAFDSNSGISSNQNIIGLSLDEIQKYLDDVDPEPLDYEGWLNVGMGICHETRGSDEGFELWLKWSEHSSKHKKRGMFSSWTSFKKPRGGRRITFRTVQKMAGDISTCQRPNGAESGHDTIAPYQFTDHGIIWNKLTKEGHIPTLLTNFTALIIADVQKDDGAEDIRYIELEACVKGRKSTLTVKAKEFSAMHWVVEKLGPEAVLHAGFSVKDRTRAAIQLLSDKMETRKIYGHLGWKKINKVWVYLHCDGGISCDGPIPDIDVELEGEKLNCYLFPEVLTGEELHQAIKATLSFIELAQETITFSLLAATFRAPLGEASPVDFSLFLVGPTGSQKTELTALIQAFYGSGFHGKNLPGNWNSTSNSLEKAAFIAKDCLFTVDDFAPSGTTYDIDRMHREAGRLLRGQGNNAGRGRMRADGGQRPEYYPRGLIVSSGEDIPKGQSIRARTWILEIAKGNVNLSRLTDAQHASRVGLFSQTMVAYLKWLAPQMDALKKSLPTRRDELRDQIRNSSFAHDRTPDMIASLLISLEMFLKFALEENGIDQSEYDALYSRGYSSILEAGGGQANHQMGEEPATRFINLISSAFVSGQAHLVGMKNGEKPSEIPIPWGWEPCRIDGLADPASQYRPRGDKVGWLKGDDIYLEPDAVFRVGQKLARDQGMGLPITQQTLWKRLNEKGYIESCEEGRSTTRVTIDGSRRRVIHLKTSVMHSSEEDLVEEKSKPANDWPASSKAS